MGAGETGGKGASLLFGGVGQIHAAANGVAIRLWRDHERLTLFRHSEHECRRMLLAPLDQLGHVADGTHDAVHM